MTTARINRGSGQGLSHCRTSVFFAAAILASQFFFAAEGRNGERIGTITEFSTATVLATDASSGKDIDITLPAKSGNWAILGHDTQKDLLRVDLNGQNVWIDPIDVKSYSIEKALVDKSAVCVTAPGGKRPDSVAYHSHGSGARKCD